MFTARPHQHDMPWGDGIDHETWSMMLSPRAWEDCADDEMIHVYPCLLPRNGGVPPRVRERIVEAAACLRRSLEPHGRAAAARRPRLRLFPVLRVDHGGDKAILELLDQLLAEIDADGVRAYDPESAALFAFTTGIHPAYIWCEALLSHEVFKAMGWLGHLARGRPAFMPRDVALYVNDVVHVSAAATVIDGLCPALALEPAAAKALRSAAKRCLEGRFALVRPARCFGLVYRPPTSAGRPH